MRPRSITTVRGETSSASRVFCSTSSSVRRSDCASCFTTRISSSTITGARPSDGSSISSTEGLPISARPIASICCSPPES
jgi:hypothetical protein